MKKSFVLPAIAGLFVSFAASATTFSDNFSGPSSGWEGFGNTNLFIRNTAQQELEVTWDSSQPNSYYYHPLGVTLTKDYDFTVDFDLQLNDITSGNEEGKTSPMAIAVGFLNFANATNAAFARGLYGSAPNVAEWDYFTSGSFTFGGNTYPIAPTLTPTFISASGSTYAPSAFIPYELTFPTGMVVHISMAYTGTNQTLVTTFTTNGVDCLDIPAVVLSVDFTADDNFAVDTFSISSYGSAGDPYDSVLAHGIVKNMVVTYPPPAVQDFSGTLTNGVWKVTLTSQSIWNYTLQRTADFQSWTDIVTMAGGDGTLLSLSDTNPPASGANYRVKAERR